MTSRRGADELIFAGQVSVNGKVIAEPGIQVDLRKDKVRVVIAAGGGSWLVGAASWGAACCWGACPGWGRRA